MAKVVIVIEDKADGTVDTKITSDTPLPEDFLDFSPAQLIAAKVYSGIEFLYEKEDQ
jgi:hypothetical protein